MSSTCRLTTSCGISCGWSRKADLQEDRADADDRQRQAAPDLAGRFGPTLANEDLDAAAAIAGGGITIGSPILFSDEISAGGIVPGHPFVRHDGRAF